MRASVLLADDHAIVVDGLRSLLEGGAFDVVGTVADGRALLEAARELQPDVIIADISMPVLGGLEATRLLAKDGVKAKVIILTMHAESHLATEALRAGASGYVLKQSAGNELIAAIGDVLRGDVYVTPLLAKDVLTILAQAGKAGPARPRGPRLTPRRREVLRLIAAGRTMKEIAHTLGISQRTVESHKYALMEEIGVGTTAELIQYAIKTGLIST